MASISDILMAQGRQAAESRRTRAGTWTPLIQHLANLPGQIMQDRQAERGVQEAAFDRAQQRDVRGQQVAKGQRDLDTAASVDKDEQALTAIFASPGVLDDTGTVDIHKAVSLAQQQAPRLVPRLMEAAQKHDEGVQQAALRAAQTAAAERSNQPAAPAPYTLNPGDRRFGADNTEVASVPAEAKPDTRALNLQLKDALGKGPAGRAEANAIRQAIREAAEAGRDPNPVSAQPSFQSKEVLNDEGKAVPANYNSRTGVYTEVGTNRVIQNPRVVPSAMETQDARKFKQAAPILSGVSELSEKINTQQGLIAKMSGSVEKVKAQANYNDDVAEYEALISGFTPLVARALGHTGVLTQQDVDSVKALFPRPGDSKSLRDRKITRIKTIIGELESGASPAGGATDQGGGVPTVGSTFQGGKVLKVEKVN